MTALIRVIPSTGTPTTAASFTQGALITYSLFQLEKPIRLLPVSCRQCDLRTSKNHRCRHGKVVRACRRTGLRSLLRWKKELFPDNKE
jgi:hypothetical protein